ncbi:uncharacterized protein TRUGW13939_09979 [Talaromyces rugulosus]|uniref:Lipoyl-binding domain-containing protein n=1 Tax=Talaromyces rugulosus TaxID=121627 RepID=A0A7H8R8S8_TALRU|nr:uncharacterized protein TRUGW13939_09979 [Talaromyces rugulosus]QKX62814.1 hypothetical protein TRUGW13939_09979 [Talaromyces rugulosus]
MSDPVKDDDDIIERHVPPQDQQEKTRVVSSSSKEEIVDDGPSALVSRSRQSLSDFFTIFASGFALISDGYQNNLMTMTNVLLKKEYPQQYASTVSTRVSNALLVGEVIGQVVIGLTCDYLGRKWAIVATTLMILGSAAIAQLSPHFSQTEAIQQCTQAIPQSTIDPVNIHCDVITAVNSPYNDKEASLPVNICIWKAQNAGQSFTNVKEAWLSPIPESLATIDGSSPAGAAVPVLYHSISQELRSGRSISSTPYHVKIESWYAAGGSNNVPVSWKTSTMQVSVNGTRILVHIALPSVDPHTAVGQVDISQPIFCHIPAIGTYIEFKRDTLLSFAESTRSVAKSKDGSEEKTMVAPMPCKVLSVLKNNGDEVKAGEAVMLIESMKMEVSIAVSTAGKFETTRKKGEAVEEGKVLCSVT